MSEFIIHFILQDIYEFHNELEKQFRLSPGIHDYKLLESAVNAPFQTFMGEAIIFDKAAQLCY